MIPAATNLPPFPAAANVRRVFMRSRGRAVVLSVHRTADGFPRADFRVWEAVGSSWMPTKGGATLRPSEVREAAAALAAMESDLADLEAQRLARRGCPR